MYNHYIFYQNDYLKLRDLPTPEAFAIAYNDYQKPPTEREHDWKDSMYFTDRWEIQSY